MLTPRNLTMVAWGLAALKAHQPLLLKRIGWQVIQKLDGFDARTLANLVWAFATLDVRELDLTIAGAALYPKIAERAIAEVWRFRPQELANVLWAFATLAIRHPALFAAAAEAVLAMLSDLNTFDLGQTVWAFAAVRLRDDALFGAIAARVKTGHDDKEHKPINVSNLCWAYAKVEYSDDAYFRHLAWIAKSKLSCANPQDLCNQLWSFAAMKIQDPELSQMIGAKAIGLVRSFAAQEITSLLWAFARLDEPNQAFFDAGFEELCGERTILSINQREISMCLWALMRCGMDDRAWGFFQRILGMGIDPGVTACSTLLAVAQRTRKLGQELSVWQTLLDHSEHPLLVSAFAVAAAMRCCRQGEPARALAFLQTSAVAGATRTAAWQQVRMLCCGNDVCGEPQEQLVAKQPLAALPPIAPRREGMGYAELYAKELEVVAAADVDVANAVAGICGDDSGSGGDAAITVLESIERWVELGETWLKLAGGEKAIVLDRLVDARRPRLLVEIGFYVGYSSTRMARRLRAWGGRLVSIEVDPVHAAIGQVSVVLAGLSDVVDVWVGHSAEVVPRLLDEFGPGSVDMAFFDQKGTLYHMDLAKFECLGLVADGCLVVADNVIKPGAPRFLWDLHHSPSWDLQVVSLREYSSEAIEDWMSVSVFDAGRAAVAAEAGVCVPPPPRSFEALAFETDAMRWRAMTQELSVSDWARHAQFVRLAFEDQGIRPTAVVDSGKIEGLVPVRVAAAT